MDGTELGTELWNYMSAGFFWDFNKSAYEGGFQPIVLGMEGVAE